MENIWKPDDNIFVTQLTVELENARYSLNKLMQIKNEAEVELDFIENKVIPTMLQNMNYLRKEAKIVKLKEFQYTQKQLKKATFESAKLKKIIELHNNSISKVKNKIDKILKEMEASRFKLLEFKKRE